MQVGTFNVSKMKLWYSDSVWNIIIYKTFSFYLLTYDAVGWAAGRASTSFGWGKGGNVTSAT